MRNVEDGAEKVVLNTLDLQGLEGQGSEPNQELAAPLGRANTTREEF